MNNYLNKNWSNQVVLMRRSKMIAIKNNNKNNKRNMIQIWSKSPLKYKHIIEDGKLDKKSKK